MRSVERPDGRRVESGSAGAAPLALVGFRDPVRDIVNDLFNATLDLVASLFADIIGEFLLLSTDALNELESVYQISMVAYFALLGLFGLSMAGYFQLFPGEEQADPLRFLGRAVPATISLWIVNPPGWGSDLFVRGAYAWAIAVTNALAELFLSQMGSTISFQSDTLAGSLGGPFVLVGFAATIGSSAIIAELLLVLGLLLRQALVYVTYAIYPLLIAFWVADAGPLSYAKELSDKLLKTTVTLLAGGVLLAALFALGLGLIGGSSQIFAGGAPPAPDGAVTGGDFSSHSSGDAVLNALLKLLVLIVMCVLPVMLIKQMLGAVGDMAASAVTQTASLAAGAATGGAGSLAVSGASAAAKQGATQAAKKAGKAVAKKGVGGAAKQAAKRAPGAVKEAGKRAAKRAPAAAKEVGRKAARGGPAAVRDGARDAAAARGQETEERPNGARSSPAPEPSQVSTRSSSRASGSSGQNGRGSSGLDSEAGPPRNPSLGSGRRYSRR